MLGPAEVLILGALIVPALLLITRLLCKRKRIRLILAGVSALILSGVALIVVACSFPGPLSWVLPYENVGSWKVTDLSGNACVVEVSVKYLSNTIPPGVKPRLKLEARWNTLGSDTLTFDTGWRFGLADIRPVDGGIDVFTGLGCNRNGLHMQVERERRFLSLRAWHELGRRCH